MLRWTPRILGLGSALFLSLFALDAFDGRPLLTDLPGFLLHLAPAFLVLGAVALAWRRPLAGATAFTALALAYAFMVRWRLDWIAVIAGPFVVIAALLVLSWHAGRASRPPGSAPERA
jgi:hypothetical protein